MSKKITTAIDSHTNEPITIDEALLVRDSVHFVCDDCGERVIAHKRSKTGSAAHFEHKQANPLCKY
ncbi:hypothetical protein JCM19239_5297 [Vibrio variabilis]|uniref:Uncharacterized protein n=1 Tax=Vibrio variabilis TaxID=990271 RepID=A0ABQ0JPW3_9VIBR|nr:hypothetical protein JCM19239_5297 [Vibrio variabilis]